MSGDRVMGDRGREVFLSFEIFPENFKHPLGDRRSEKAKWKS